MRRLSQMLQINRRLFRNNESSLEFCNKILFLMTLAYRLSFTCRGYQMKEHKVIKDDIDSAYGKIIFYMKTSILQ